MKLGDRIRKLREKKGWSQAYLGELVGNKQQTIASIENNETDNPRKLKKIANVLGTSEERLRYGDQIAPAQELSYYSIPVLTHKDIHPWLESHILPNQEKLMGQILTTYRVGKSAFGFRVSTDAMAAPDNMVGAQRYSILAGDIAVVDPDLQVENNNRVAVEIEGSLSVRLYKHEEGRQFLIAYNPNYPTITVTKKINILGVVVETRRDQLKQL